LIQQSERWHTKVYADKPAGDTLERHWKTFVWGKWLIQQREVDKQVRMQCIASSILEYIHSKQKGLTVFHAITSKK
jgi:hypothetical protein